MLRTFGMMMLGVSTLGLSACTNNTLEPVTIDDAEEALRIFSKGTGDAGDVIDDGDTLTARKVSSAALDINYATGITGHTDPSKTGFQLFENEAGELTAIINGFEFAFSEDDRDVTETEEGDMVYGYNFEDPEADEYFSLFNYNGELDEIFENGHGYLYVLGYQTNLIDGGAENQRGFVIVGTETMDADLAALATATYEGRTRVNLAPNTGWVNNSTSRIDVQSDLTMTANFGEGTISGLMDNLETRLAGEEWEDLDGSVTMNTANFDINGFRGTLTGNGIDGGAITISNAEYSGAFYGGEAEEVGGVIVLDAETEDGPMNGMGFFIGDTYE